MGLCFAGVTFFFIFFKRSPWKSVISEYTGPIFTKLSPTIFIWALYGVRPMWARGNPPFPFHLFTSPPSTLSFCMFYFFSFSLSSLLALSVFLLFHLFPFYQNSPTSFPVQSGCHRRRLNLALVFCVIFMLYIFISWRCMVFLSYLV